MEKGHTSQTWGTSALPVRENIQTFSPFHKALQRWNSAVGATNAPLLADSIKIGQDNLLGALEIAHTDGPWDVPENYMKYNGLLTYSHGDTSLGWSATALGYHGTWNATNQIPDLAVADGLVRPFRKPEPDRRRPDGSLPPVGRVASSR